MTPQHVDCLALTLEEVQAMERTARAAPTPSLPAPAPPAMIRERVHPPGFWGWLERVLRLPPTGPIEEREAVPGDQ